MKKLTCLFLILVLIIVPITPAFAGEAEYKDFKSVVEYVACSFMRNSYDKDFRVRETTEFVDFQGNITAYHVALSINDKPCGYVLISLLTEGDPIVEFSYEGDGLVDTISKTIPECNSIDNPLVYLGPDLLFINDNKSNLAIDVFTGKTYKSDDIKNDFGNIQIVRDSGYSNGGGMLDWSNASVSANSIFEIYEFGSSSDYWTINTLSSGGNYCAPTAGTNIIWYWGEHRNRSWVQPFNYSTNQLNAQAVFNILKSAMMTLSTGTADFMVPNGYNTYLSAYGTYYSISAVTTNNYNSFVTALNSDCPVHTMLRPNSSPTCDGHDVMALGYAQSTTGTDYLIIMDGWTNISRVLNFSYYTSGTRLIKGYKIWVGAY